MTALEDPDTPRSIENGAQAPGPSATEGEPGQPEGTAAYIADLSNELAGLARIAGLDTLAFLLEIVQLEANGVVRGTGELTGSH